jgi:hypothetical protein
VYTCLDRFWHGHIYSPDVIKGKHFLGLLHDGCFVDSLLAIAIAELISHAVYSFHSNLFFLVNMFIVISEKVSEWGAHVYPGTNNGRSATVYHLFGISSSILEGYDKYNLINALNNCIDPFNV